MSGAGTHPVMTLDVARMQNPNKHTIVARFWVDDRIGCHYSSSVHQPQVFYHSQNERSWEGQDPFLQGHVSTPRAAASRRI